MGGAVLRPVLLLLAATLATGCVLEPKSYWVRDTLTVERFDYAGWEGLLRDHVRDGAVDYPALSRDGRLGEFVNALRRGRFTKRTTREQRLAFLINGYNALVISAVLKGGSPATLGVHMTTFHDVPADLLIPALAERLSAEGAVSRPE